MPFASPDGKRGDVGDSATICAIATAPAAGGIGVIRVSGPLALEATRPLTRGLPDSPAPRQAYFAAFTDRAGAELDEGLFLFFAAPRSYTGEDVVELQVHGGPKLLSLLLREVLADGRLRLAEPGEFSRRAFLNGRMDLTRADAVANLVAAESEAAVRAAAAQLRGALAERVAQVRVPLGELQADVEGVLNFPDEAEGAEDGLATRLAELLSSARALVAEARRGQLVRRGARVVLFGPVNAGKSTLLNALVGHARALVDEAPGTTRDTIEATVELEGLGVTLVDTAGLRDQPGRIEALGIARTRAALAGADLALLLLPPETSGIARASWRAEAGDVPVLEVWSKSDLVRRNMTAQADPSALLVSARTGAGLEAVRGAVLRALWGSGVPGAVFSASESMVEAIARAAEALERAHVAVRSSTLEVVAGELGLAAEALGQITGESAPDVLIDAIFRRFCIGK